MQLEKIKLVPYWTWNLHNMFNNIYIVVIREGNVSYVEWISKQVNVVQPILKMMIMMWVIKWFMFRPFWALWSIHLILTWHLCFVHSFCQSLNPN